MTETRWQHLDTREIGGRTVVWHWPATQEAFCVDSGRAVRYEAGDRCLRHGAADRPCTTGLRTPPECRHERLSPNHPHPHCSECGQDAEDGTVTLSYEGDVVAVSDAEHIVRWDPPRALAEVDAKRRILDWAVNASTIIGADGYNFDVEQALRLLALPMAGRDGYRSEWVS